MGLQKVAVLVMSAVVLGSPLLAADVAELVPTHASHMVTSVDFLDYELTLTTLPILEVLLKKLDFLVVAGTGMDC